ncbi:MAG TPA: hypothetical protein GXX51_02875 [Firmicutes bacterium]|nr:hypothetical protein [Bacillota bacterium]
MAQRSFPARKSKAAKMGGSNLRRAVDLDDKDFLDMIMAEVNEEEAADVLGEPAERLWARPQDGEEIKDGK